MAALADWFATRPVLSACIKFLHKGSNQHSLQAVTRSFSLAFPPPSIPGYKMSVSPSAESSK
jgi:hypothetical protein